MHDLIVVGGGPVGASLARAARGLSVALVAQERRQPAPRAPFDARVYALSPGQRRVPADDRRMAGHSAGAGGAGARDAHLRRRRRARGSSSTRTARRVPELAWIVEDALLQDALWSGLEAEVFAPARCASLGMETGHAVLALADGERVRREAGGRRRRRAVVRAHAGGHRGAAKATTARARWWRISAARGRMATLPTSGSSAARCSRCCRFPASTSRWSGRCRRTRPRAFPV